MKFENVKSWDDVLSTVDRDYFNNPITEQDIPSIPGVGISGRGFTHRGSGLNFRATLQKEYGNPKDCA